MIDGAPVGYASTLCGITDSRMATLIDVQHIVISVLLNNKILLIRYGLDGRTDGILTNKLDTTRGIYYEQLVQPNTTVSWINFISPSVISLELCYSLS